VETITIATVRGTSHIMVGERWQDLLRHIPARRPVVITDVNVDALYPLNVICEDVITIGSGERLQTLDTIRDVYQRLMALEVDRSCFLVGIGGGVVCDITGFVATTFLRGLRFGFIATTLLAQVDAAIGGKNGVNMDGFKNMIGTFNPPEFVICDTNLLQTLPVREVQNGFAEIIKHAAIADAALFAFLEQHHQSARALDDEVIAKLVVDSVRIKSSIVTADETENGLRRILNFGHTLGHALERTAGLAHGEAVSRGMAAAAALSVRRGMLADNERQRLQTLLEAFQLPVALETGDAEKICRALRQDKKREGRRIHFVWLEKIGKAVVKPIALRELEELIHDISRRASS